ncbi:conserved hypothetical protein [Culex quinquefasciatus]|uniref:Translocon-associated protein subunit alpha n=1 Tax=Culex quinquefasciatus TaxID=7176 RepID=B0XHD0_CULQU|nr:conserved hypothetical protein [Culex quinquefasciatus]|eukprot:XP_001869052.1 conserved hypothetical protein [Culex quinquefasciatus]
MTWERSRSWWLASRCGWCHAIRTMGPFLRLPTQVTHLNQNCCTLLAGYPAEFLVGFDNKGSDHFIVETIQASFRYRMDFDYFFQNISAIGHPFGINIAPIYREASGNHFSEAVFKKIFSIIGVDWHGRRNVLQVRVPDRNRGAAARRRSAVPRFVWQGQSVVGGAQDRRTGNTNNKDVDYEWIPAKTLKKVQNSPKFANPRQRSGPSETTKSRFSCATHPPQGWWSINPINYSDPGGIANCWSGSPILEDAIDFVSQILTTDNLGVEPRCWIGGGWHCVRTLRPMGTTLKGNGNVRHP